MQYGKRLIIFFLALISYGQLLAQSPAYADITGLWKGTMYNDTTKLNYRYEIAISEKKGKLSGYSHTYFIINNKEYHGVKKIKIRREGNEVVVQDVELIANNYPIKPPKGVHMINVLKLSIKDNKMALSGNFETNRTKEYAPATGFINVERKNNFNQSALIPHLQELGLAEDLSFIKEAKEAETLASANTTSAPVKNETVTLKPEPVETVQTTSEKPISTAPVKNETIASTPTPAEITKTTPPVTVKAAPVKKETAPVINNKQQPAIAKSNTTKVVKTEPPKTAPAPDNRKETAVTVKTETVKETPAVVIKPIPAAVANAATEINNRKIETIESVYYKSDSLELTLYDNGEVDGDTVSVLMNGEVIMPRVGLSTNAVRKKISTVNTGDSIQLIMYAENLGKLPPNTGLLIVYDGTDRYEIRFSGDYKKNAAIVFRKKQE
ncbi:MAG TPA: hypothetical protein PK987_04115 [Ferruginibacter sp.]|nr:hypothetical protein [Ferruginibacter sp.]